MASKRTTSNDILVKVDHNNLIYIDPNSVLSDGTIQQRQVEPENLVMYVNLEADLIPRTTLIASDNTATMVSIGKLDKPNKLNFLQNANGRDYDTTWTESYTTFTERKDVSEENKGTFTQYDNTAQSFGIESVEIKVAGTNFIPQVTIKFIDVRGKTLFESPENSPYRAFFHLPWPVFYLTVKGYYGKAIRYRLHLVSFSSKYNSQSGNFEIDTTFVGSTYAYLCDIPMDCILNAPYLYPIEQTPDAKYNPATGTHQIELKKTSRGYRMLESVYNEYKQKGLLPENFPVKTLREVLVIARRLNKILENQIFTKVVDPRILAGIQDFEGQIVSLENAVNAWKKKNLSGQTKLIGEKYYYVQSKTENKTNLNAITGMTSNKLEFIINNGVKNLNQNQAFGKDRDKKLINNLTYDSISLDDLLKIQLYIMDGTEYLVDYEEIIRKINDVQKKFLEQVKKVEAIIETEMNKTVSNPDFGMGFEPSVRNLVGVILANADTYVRLLKDVHQTAFQKGTERKKLIENYSKHETQGECIFPWPEIKLTSAGVKHNVLIYPGSSEVADKLKIYDESTDLWPEIRFVENFYSVSTKRIEPLTEKEGNADIVEFIFADDSSNKRKMNIAAFTHLVKLAPYNEKTVGTILYEIWERAKFLTTFDSFDSNALINLADIDFDNLQNQIYYDYDIVGILRSGIKKNINNYTTLMYNYSPHERYQYYLDELPSMPYLQDVASENFNIEKYLQTNTMVNDETLYQKLNENLNNYVCENYRTKIYPFNSSTYLGYLGASNFTTSEMDLRQSLKVDVDYSFIHSPIQPNAWFIENFHNNLFNNILTIDGYNRHILNTPYFHRQLFNDYKNSLTVGKYAGSAYLLLNSLGLKDLDDKINFYDMERSDNFSRDGVLMSTLFREVGATHYIPYHLMLKWGAIYHRYKKFIMDGVDIIENITYPINGNLFYDNNADRPYQLNDSDTVQRSQKTNLGINPFYQNVFHDVVNDYGFYDQPSTTGTTDYYNLCEGDVIINTSKTVPNYKLWTSFIDNSKFDDEDLRYTLLPSNGYKDYDTIVNNDYYKLDQENYRIIWTTEDNQVPSYSGQTFPTYDQNFKSDTSFYSISNNNHKVIDLIATFSPDILDAFENAFIEFSSLLLKEEIPYIPYDFEHYNFQKLLKSIVSVKKESTDPTDINSLIDTIKTKQQNNLKLITSQIISDKNLIAITLANPKEIDNHLLWGFTGQEVQNYGVDSYDASQLTQENLDYIKLYLGEDIDEYYQNFFLINDVKLNEDNILDFRFIIYIYAGYIKSGGTNDKTSFINYLNTNIVNPQKQRFATFMTEMILKCETLQVETGTELKIDKGYADDPIKLELYNMFKSFNDKWIGGNSIGQRTLMEEFLFLDKANRDIGDQVYLNMERLIEILAQKNQRKVNLFSLINILIKDSGFDIRALPGYVNFYGTNFNNKYKVMPSKTVASTLFGTFLEVDYQDASPKILLQYMGPTSKHLQLEDVEKKYKFKDDSFDISSTNNNPIIVAPDIFRQTDFVKSNKAVAFEVSFGDQNQSIFKAIQLDQTSIKNTSESFQVLENLGNSESGSSTAQVDIGLFDIYRQASYTCDVTAMGNAMIQPTMYFYLKNVPLFRGSYWITQVTHTVRVNGIETTFQGSRLPLQSLPNPKDSFMASYRALFDKLLRRAKIKTKAETAFQTGREKIIYYPDPENQNYSLPYTIDLGLKSIPDEDLVDLVGITKYGIRFNGYEGEKYVQMVNYPHTPTNSVGQSTQWLRAYVTILGSPMAYQIDEDTNMSILSKFEQFGAQNKYQPIEYKEIKSTDEFYMARFDLGQCPPNRLETDFPITEFLKPSHDRGNVECYTITTNYDFINKNFTGPVSVGPAIIYPTPTPTPTPTEGSIPGASPTYPNFIGYGIALSPALAKKLNVIQDDVLYFRLLES